MTKRCVDRAVRRRALISWLFDEGRKAHPDVFNILVAGLDDGCVDRRQRSQARLEADN